MYSRFQIAKKYAAYYLAALNGRGHGMHSPFVFQFVLNVLNNKQKYQPPQNIEVARRQLLQNKTVLQVDDFGAGSSIAKTKNRSIAQITKTAVKSKKYSHLLYLLVQQYKPQTIIELGTSLGVTTAYLAAANSAATVYTIEGSSAVQKVAAANFKELGLKNVKSFRGSFDDILPTLLKQLQTIDLAYIDGNHHYKPTIEYFNLLLEKKTNDSIFIFDDIHWSAEMEQAWEEIKQHPSVSCTVDIFFLGFVFFKSEFKTPQHFTIRF